MSVSTSAPATAEVSVQEMAMRLATAMAVTMG
jgi:hypothetical protein